MITGFVLARKNVLSIETSRNLSDFVVSVALPGLTFGKIVSNISYKDLKNIGLMIFVEVLVIISGSVFGFGMNYITGNPKYFYYGLIIAAAYTNVGDLPIAFIQGIPSIIFSNSEVDRGVAYICIQGFTQLTTIFNLGLLHVIGLDFPEDETDTVKEYQKDDSSDTASNTGVVVSSDEITNYNSNNNNEKSNFNGNVKNKTNFNEAKDCKNESFSSNCENGADNVTQNSTSLSRTASNSIRKRRMSIANSLANNEEQMHDIINEYSEVNRTYIDDNLDSLSLGKPKSRFKVTPLSLIMFVLKNFKRPASIATIAGMVVALVPWLKALFVPFDKVNYPDAPDHNPPLHFILDTATFIGNAEVPLGLLILGGTLGRLQIAEISRSVKIVAFILTIIKLVVLPIVGLAWMNEFNKLNWFDSKVEYFISILSWGLPGMTTQIYVTAYYTPVDGDHKQMDIIGVLLLTQYMFLIISFPILVTYALKNCLHF